MANRCTESNARPSPACARPGGRPTDMAAPLPLMALALGAALFLATPAQTPIAAGVTPDLRIIGLGNRADGLAGLTTWPGGRPWRAAPIADAA